MHRRDQLAWPHHTHVDRFTNGGRNFEQAAVARHENVDVGCRQVRDVPAGELLIHEIYLSVQGESTFAGLPCVFVRTSVCDSRCAWCDTPHAFNRGERMPRAEVLAKALGFGCPLVEITGVGLQRGKLARAAIEIGPCFFAL